MNLGDIADLFASMMENVHTAIPATVVSTSGAFVTARPSVGMMLENGQKITIPDLENVRLLMLGSSGFVIDIELKEGDPILLIVLSADARKWIAASEWKESKDAASPLRHSLGGCIAIPLCWADGKQQNIISISSSGKMRIENAGGAKIVLEKTGIIEVSNATQSAKGLFDDAWDELNGLATDVNTWASGFIPLASANLPVTPSQIVPLSTFMVQRIISITAKMQKVGQLLK